MKLLLLLSFLFTSQLYSQSLSLNKLEEKRKELKQEILVLQYSVNLIEDQIAKFPIKDLSEPLRAYGLKGAILRKEPSKKGTKLLTLKKDTSIQVIDIIKSFYLVCISGDCGYLHKKDVRRTSSSFL